MMTSKICTQRKKSSGKFSLPNCLPLTSGKAARGSVQGETDSREIQEPSQTKKKRICVKEQMNNFYLGLIYSWTTHKWKRFVGLFLLCWDCQGFIASLLYIPFLQAAPCAWNSSAGFCRITCARQPRKALILQLSPGRDLSFPNCSYRDARGTGSHHPPV